MNKFIFSLILLCSCTHEYLLDQKTSKIKTNNFYNALAIGYNNLAKKEANNYDWIDSNYFARKGLNALKKNNIIPDNPGKRSIESNFYKNEITSAYNAIIKLIDIHDIKKKYPLQTARIFIIYDYWLEELEENWQEDEIKELHDEFWQTHRSIKANIALEKNYTEKINNKNFFTIYFDNYNYVLKKESLNQIIKIYNRYKLIDNKEKLKIILESYVNQDEINKSDIKIGNKRAEIIRNSLIELGINKNNFYKNSISILPNKRKLETKVEIFLIEK